MVKYSDLPRAPGISLGDNLRGRIADAVTQHNERTPDTGLPALLYAAWEATGGEPEPCPPPDPLQYGPDLIPNWDFSDGMNNWAISGTTGGNTVVRNGTGDVILNNAVASPRIQLSNTIAAHSAGPVLFEVEAEPVQPGGGLYARYDIESQYGLAFRYYGATTRLLRRAIYFSHGTATTMPVVFAMSDGPTPYTFRVRKFRARRILNLTGI